MALLGMQDVTIAFGGPPVLDQASFAIERGERACLLGRNGAGKSTLMKLLDGTLVPDGGSIARQAGITVARLEQEVPENLEGTIFDQTDLSGAKLAGLDLRLCEITEPKLDLTSFGHWTGTGWVDWPAGGTK